MSVKFAIIGVAGFVARRHLDAIRAVGGELVAALDLHDSVGLLDSYWPECRFFTSPERFDRHLNKSSTHVDYVVVCSPNWLHDAHCRWALRAGCHAICEKPLCLEPHNVDQLVALEVETGRNVYPILQLRLHDDIVNLKERVQQHGPRDIQITYITRRGSWYASSWKGDDKLSGGALMNLGIHFFDAVAWIYGQPTRVDPGVVEADKARGCAFLEDGTRIGWYLSTRHADLSSATIERGGHAERMICEVDRACRVSVVADFSENFTSLHTQLYERVLGGSWVTAAAARGGIELVHRIRMEAASR